MYARRSRSDPYPKFEDIYRHSDTFNHTDGFTDLYIQDFVYTHSRIARHRLQTLELTKSERQLYRRGVRECDEEGVPESVTLGAERVIPGGPIEGLLRVFGQFALSLPTG